MYYSLFSSFFSFFIMYTTIDTPGTIVTTSILFFPYLFSYLVDTILIFIFIKKNIFFII